MLIHKFVLFSEDKVSSHLTYRSSNQNSFVIVKDETILNNTQVFMTGFSSYWDTLSSRNEGLNYHGITIIPPSELPHFLHRLNQLQAECGIYNLINLCNSAISSNKYIVHFGI